MAFWNRKKETVTMSTPTRTFPPEPTTPIRKDPPPCIHTWVDFPWYMNHTWHPDPNSPSEGESIITIYEPYLCVHCKKRKDVQLYTERETYITAKRHWAKLAEYEEKYKDQLKPKPVVEDMINDAMYVDQGKLAIVAKLRGIKDENKPLYRVELPAL